MSFDTIAINTIRVDGRFGVSELERAHPQPIEINLVLKVDLHDAALSDNLHDTVDYAKVNKLVVAIVSTESCCLLEHLGQKILDSLFEDKRIREAMISLSKPRRLKGATPVVSMTRCNSRPVDLV